MEVMGFAEQDDARFSDQRLEPRQIVDVGEVLIDVVRVQWRDLKTFRREEALGDLIFTRVGKDLQSLRSSPILRRRMPGGCEGCDRKHRQKSSAPSVRTLWAAVGC